MSMSERKPGRNHDNHHQSIFGNGRNNEQMSPVPGVVGDWIYSPEINNYVPVEGLNQEKTEVK